MVIWVVLMLLDMGKFKNKFSKMRQQTTFTINKIKVEFRNHVKKRGDTEKP